MKTNIGVKSGELSEVAHSLNQLLADEHVLYIKTRKAHWNVEGPNFYMLHKFFEEHYTELQEIIDETAERVRMLGHYAVASMRDYLELTHLSEETRAENDSEGFILELLRDHETIILHARENIARCNEEWNDQGSADFMTGIMEKHEKMAWMLGAHIR